MCTSTPPHHCPRSGFRSLALALFALLVPGAADAAILTVGSSPGTCSATSIAQALTLAQASAANDEARTIMLQAFPILGADRETYVATVTDRITRFTAAAIDGLCPEEDS